MAYSDSIGNTTFNALKVVEKAFRRCKLPAQAITAEMTDVALESLYTTLSELASIRVPSWCIERVVLPMYENAPVVTLPAGTENVLNLNLRTIQVLEGTETETSTSYEVLFSDATVVNAVGIKWSGTAVPVTMSVSDDGTTWTEVGSSSETGTITWTDISAAKAYLYFKVTSASAMSYEWIKLGNNPSEIPLGQLNRDGYINQNNKTFPGRPTCYYFQRSVANPVVNLWPAPNVAAESSQLVLWRHRQVMDTQNLQQEIEIPARWLEAIIGTLAARVGAETPQVDTKLVMALEQKAAQLMMIAWAGDGDGSPLYLQPSIGAYTR